MVHRAGEKAESRESPLELLTAHLEAAFYRRVFRFAFFQKVVAGRASGLMNFLAGDPGIEPGTFGSGDQRSLH